MKKNLEFISTLLVFALIGIGATTFLYNAQKHKSTTSVSYIKTLEEKSGTTVKEYILDKYNTKEDIIYINSTNEPTQEEALTLTIAFEESLIAACQTKKFDAVSLVFLVSGKMRAVGVWDCATVLAQNQAI